MEEGSGNVEERNTTTISPDLGGGNEDEDGNTPAATVVVIVVVIAILLIAVIIGLWCYRRKKGHWPKPCRKNSRPPIHQNPYGNRSYASRWQPAAGSGRPSVVVGHRADYREPTPPNHKRIASITEKISERLYEASEKMAIREENARNRSRIARSEGDIFESSRKYASNENDFASKSRKLRTVHSYDGDIGLYQDRTLPTTLMMTSESQKQKFAHEESALKRSNSATLRSSSSSKSSRNPTKSRRQDSGRMQLYNDFGPNSSLRHYRNRRNVRRPSHVSSKPSNTSDYVSDVETVLTDRTIGKSGRNSSLPSADFNRNHNTESDSVIPDPNDSFEIYQNKLRQALHPEVPPLAILRADLHHRGQIKEPRKGPYIDERTESQQNTMTSESFYKYKQDILEEERSTIEGQSSDTESMAESSLAATEDSSFSFKRRQYNSDNEFLDRTGSRRGKTRRRKPRRSRSDGWDSEPNESTKRRRPRARDTPRPRSNLRGMDNPAFNIFDPSTKSVITPQSHFDDVTSLRRSQRSKTSKPSPKMLPSNYESASLKTPVVGTLIEMPIYSQATWAGPDGYKQGRRKHEAGKRNTRSGSATTSRKPPKVKRTNRAGRKLSIGGGGKYFCEFDSLPVDLSKLPKDLVAKIGGRTDQLLEPIEHLNFDQLCRPLPNLGKEGQLSARRMLTDRLPPDHRDREVLSNTYEVEGTDIVMTDL